MSQPDRPSLFAPVRSGALSLPNRIVMAPLTRNRAGRDNVPSCLAALYYAQRASAGMIIAEATQIRPDGQGYLNTPGIHSAEQIAGWRRVTDAVHAKAGRIWLQIGHVGRISHHSLQPAGGAPLAPSAIQANAKTFVPEGFVPVSMPRALTVPEIVQLVADFAQAAEHALAAGFYGVEIHAANGYLIDQFLRDGANQRTDAYGGSISHRVRFLLEVVDAVGARIGSGRTGVRISPVNRSNDLVDHDPLPLFMTVAGELGRRQIAYLHVVEAGEAAPPFDFAALRAKFAGPYIANGGYDRARAITAVQTGRADLVAFGRPFIANPDLVDRLQADLPLAEADAATYYQGGARGYTDYPTAKAALTDDPLRKVG